MGFIIPVVIVIAWEALARAGSLPPNWFPAPSVVALAIFKLAKEGELWGHILITLFRLSLGFVFGALAGTLLGWLTGCSRTGRRLLDPLLQSLRNIPSLAWVPLFLLWLGIHEDSKIALIAVGAFFPVYLNLSSAIANVDPKLLEVGRTFMLGRIPIFTRIILPAALPSYIVGLRSGLGLAWMFVVAAEIMGASKGLGYLMIDGQMTARPAIIIGSILLFALLGKGTDFLLEKTGGLLLAYKKA